MIKIYREPIGITVIAECDIEDEPKYVIMKCVDAKTVKPYENKTFYIHPELPGVTVYTGDIINNVASIIGKDLVSEKDYPNAIKYGKHTRVDIDGWNKQYVNG